ncbi:MAG: hypothetical protein ACP5XB_31975 [Isosphaeraceae bacterium]
MKTQAERRLGWGLAALGMTLVWGAATPATSHAAPMYSITDLGPALNYGSLQDLTITPGGQLRTLGIPTGSGGPYAAQVFQAGAFTAANPGNASDPAGSYPYLIDSATGKGVQIVAGSSAGAEALSSNGAVVGFSVGTSGERPFVYTTAQGMVDLSFGHFTTQMYPSPSGSYPDYAGINSQGLVVGSYGYGASGVSAFMNSLDPKSFAYGGLDLNTLLPPKSGWVLQTATGISDAGQIVGYGYDPSGKFSAYELTPAGNQVPEPSVLAFFGMVCAGMAVRAAVRRRRERLTRR